MAVDSTDGCINIKMVPADPEELEVGSSGGHKESQDSHYNEVGTYSQIAQLQPATQNLHKCMSMQTVSQGLEKGLWGLEFRTFLR